MQEKDLAIQETMLGPGADVPGPGPAQGASAPVTGAPGDLAPGTRVGEYVVESVLGRGGMGTVYGGKHPLIGKRVAIKVLATALCEQPELVRRFVDEARAVNKIGHPNIIDIFSFGQLPDGRHYFVMEFLEGTTLGTRLRDGPLPAAEIERLLRQVCDALGAAHSEKIIHRDLKPDNIWIASPRHGEPFVKLLDFGIAKLQDTTQIDNVTQTGVAMGTPQFMSPEQCIGRAVDHRTDIYALGVILYQLVTGRLPFEGASFAEVIAKQMTAKPVPPSEHVPVPAALERLILSCLEKDPDRRPRTTGEIATLLGHALRAPPDQKTRPGYPGEDASVMRRPGAAPRRRFVVWLTAAGVVLGAFAAFLLSRGGARSGAVPEARHPDAAPEGRPDIAGEAAPASASAARAGAPGPAADGASAAAVGTVDSAGKAERKRVAPRRDDAREGASPATGREPDPGPSPAPSPREEAQRARSEKRGLVTDNPF